ADLAKNPVLANAGGTFTTQLGKVTVYGALLEQVSARLQLQQLSLRIVEASLRTFGGQVKATGQANLRSPALDFQTQGSVSSISARDAFKTYFPKYERTLEGTLDASWNISGAAYPASARVRSLSGGAKILA